jgi:pimeloyl-ACP methyl ester carboxylesterase
LLFNIMPVFRLAMRIASPFICGDPRFPDMMDRDLSRTTVESFLLSIASLRRTDLRPMLSQIKVPVLGMFGDGDNIVNPLQWQPLQEGVSQARVVHWKKAKHFVMLDVPQDFTQKLKDFLGEEEIPAS